MSKPMEGIDQYSVDEIKEKLAPFRVPVSIAVYGTENYFNLGGVIRLGHNFLVKEIIGIDIPKHYKRADMGARKFEKITRISLLDFVYDYGHRNIVSFEARPGMVTKDIRGYEYPEDPILLFGSEKWGVPDGILEMSADIVSVPVFGVQNDHNINVAAAMVMYDFCYKHPQHYTTRPIGDLPV